MSEPTKTFADFGVDPAICDSLAEVGITQPFPIQELTLPLALSGADIIGQARTGTGKTLGFGLPLLQRIDPAGGLQALVIVPTRELCLQVAEDLAQAGRGKGVRVAALYGGKAMQPQIDALDDGAQLVVGTPGRLLDLARRGHLDLSGVAGLVLDEADEMLDLGFLPDVEQLIEQCAEQRQTLLFSATMPAEIVALARRYMTKPTFMRADVEEVRIAPETTQYFFSCHRMDKPAVLARILQTPNRGLCVVFCRTKRMADILAEELRERDVPAQAIHSDLRQEARERALQKFREGKTTVLCATEVAARGLDIDDVTHVVNYDCPDDEKMYLHRIGRTGRAGAAGVAITLAVWNELPRLEMIRRELGIEDEVHEVFSTSPLLDELFDLPPREERKKVPSPPQARSGKESQSRRRAKKATTTDQPARRDRDDRQPTSAAQDGDGGGEDDGATRRRRTRTRTRTRTVTARSAAAGSQDAPSAGDVDEGGDANGEGNGVGEARQTRQRTTERSAGRKRSGRQDRARRGSGDDEGGTPQGVKADRGEDRGQDRGQDRSEERKGRTRNGRDRGDRGRRDRKGDGRDRKGAGDRDGGRDRGRRATVDTAAARGEGTPRLSRKLEVAHLP